MRWNDWLREDGLMTEETVQVVLQGVKQHVSEQLQGADGCMQLDSEQHQVAYGYKQHEFGKHDSEQRLGAQRSFCGRLRRDRRHD